ncbi:MAG: GNAT family protein [Parvularculaceae bacterium]
MAFLRSAIGSFERADSLFGDALYLRRPELSDYSDWADIRGRSRAFLTPWEPVWASDELTRTAYRRRLRRYSRDGRDGAGIAFFAFRAEDDRLVGGVTLSNIRRGAAAAAAIGYWVGADFARRGYATEAARLAIAFGFGPYRLNRIEAACLPENTASKALLQKIGFRQEGLARQYLKIGGDWRDHLIFSLLKSEFRK